MTADPPVERWGSKETWLRALFVRSNVLWAFRQEFPRLPANQYKWLDHILVDGLTYADLSARTHNTNEEAFNQCLHLIKGDIERFIDLYNYDDELGRLEVLAESASICDVIQRTFNTLAKNAKQIYRGTDPRKVSLDREWLRDHPIRNLRAGGDYNDPYHVNARTVTKERNAAIELQVHLDEFDAKSLLAIPALLTHELVSHAHAKEDRYSPNSLWAEGVMDWVASYFFEKWCGLIGLPYGPTLRCGHDLWQSRLSRPRHLGRMAADTLVDWWIAEPTAGALPVALGTTAHLAIQVNSIRAPLIVKDEFASRVADIWADKILQGKLRAWRSGSVEAGHLLT